MSSHRYTLEPYKGIKTRYVCPRCHDPKKSFVRYIDVETGEHLSYDVGKCNHNNSCNYHKTPKDYFRENNISKPEYKPKPKFQKMNISIPAPPSYIEPELFKSSLKSYDQNNFIQFLIHKIGAEETNKAIEQYFIGTSKHWHGATTFWQIDINGKIRTGKVMLYDPGSGKRIKEPFSHISWVHSVMKLRDYNLNQCFFGEHLLKNKTKPVAIVESEKTAVIASRYLPQFIWVAVGGLSNLTEERCKILEGRTVVLYPDLKATADWDKRAKELSHIANFQVSNILEEKCTEEERKDGLDIADFLLKIGLEAFLQSQILTPDQEATAGAKDVQHSVIDEENRIFNKMVEKNPLVKELAERLKLRSEATGKIFTLINQLHEDEVNILPEQNKDPDILSPSDDCPF